MYHTTVSPSGTVVNQPVGWKDSGPSLERDPKYHSLIEYFKGTFVWYGSARNFIRDVEDVDGVDGKIRLTIEIYYSSAWETVFDGKLDLSQLEDVTKKGTYYKMNVPIIRDDFWSKFISRSDTPVDLQAAVDLEGNARTAVNKIILPLPSQIIQKTFERRVDWADNVLRTLDETALIAADVSGLTTIYSLFSNADLVINELPKIIDYGTIFKTSKPTLDGSFIFKAELSGSHTFTASIRYTYILSTSRTFTVKWYRAIKSEGVITETQIGSTQSGTGSLITDDGARTLSLTVDLLQGDEFYIWGEVGLSSAVATMSYFPDYDSDLGAPFSPVYTELEIIGNTVFQDSITDAYLIKDAAESILSKIVGQNSVVDSDLFATEAKNYAMAKMLHLRGWTFSQKPMTMTWNQWWNCFEPTHNLGLGYTEVASVKKIKIEKKEAFYNYVPVVYLNNVIFGGRKHDLENYFNKITIGFSNWSIEKTRGIDDVQTTKTYNITAFSTVGKEKIIKSDAFAASLGIEQVRRQLVESSKDLSVDEKIAMIAVKDLGGGNYTPEVGTDFAAITNITNPDTRYNVRLFVARIFKRWQKFLTGMLQHTTGEYFYFGSGEGNVTATSQLESTDYEATASPDPVLAENGNIEVDNEVYNVIPQIHSVTCPMSWATYQSIVANKDHAIGLIQDDGSYLPYFIKSLDFIHARGQARMEVWKGQLTPPLTPESFILMEDGNYILQEDGTNIETES